MQWTQEGAGSGQGTENRLPLTRDEAGLSDPGRRSFLALGAALFITAAASVPCRSRVPDEWIAPRKESGGDPGPSAHSTGSGSSSQAAGPLFLTFDDGPARCTEAILDQLASRKQKATFFVIGRHLTNKTLRASAIRALKEGHELGNHSYSHPRFSEISVDRAKQEIKRTHDLIEELVQAAGVEEKRQNRFFRYPFGDPGTTYSHRAMKDLLSELAYRPAWWDVDTRDYLPRRSSSIIALMEKVQPRDVILLHDRRRTADTLPKLLDVVDSKKMVSFPLSTFVPALVWNEPFDRSAVSISYSRTYSIDDELDDISFEFE